MRLARSTLAMAAALLVFSASFAAPAAPKKKKEKDLATQQLDYAKQLYGEGLEAMSAKDYPTAVAKFQDAYRYAPDKHLFTYNIGSAAELAGDCQMARTYFQMFVDLVPDHPEHAAAEKTLKRLNEECVAAPSANEPVEKVEVADKKDRAKERAQIDAEKALGEVLEETRKAARMYEAVAAKNGGAQPFKRIAAAKRRHVKRIIKLFASHGVDVAAPGGEGEEAEAGFVPSTLPDACRTAASHEKRSARVYEEVLEHYDTREMWRVMKRYANKADNRYRPAFQDNCPKK